MGSSKKGMLNVLIAAVLWGSSGVCAQYIMQQSQMSSPFLTMTRLLFAGLILLMLSFVHGDKIFRVLQKRQDAFSLLFFSLFGALTVQYTFLMTIEKSNAATATVLQFLSPTIIVAWFALARKTRPGPLVLAAIGTSLAGTFLLVTHGNPTTLSISPSALLWGWRRHLPPRFTPPGRQRSSPGTAPCRSSAGACCWVGQCCCRSTAARAPTLSSMAVCCWLSSIWW
jgi:drug/metabolite transporter (DMT)-like permease